MANSKNIVPFFDNVASGQFKQSKRKKIISIKHKTATIKKDGKLIPPFLVVFMGLNYSGE